MTLYSHIPVIVIAGPTAVGKTDLSIQLAHAINGEVINGDSLQVYRTLDIGTGKITQDEMQGVSHHLLDILDVSDSFDASQFKQQAVRTVLDIHARGKVPIIVGGTGLYLEGLLYNLEFGGENSHQLDVRKRLLAEAERIGSQAMWERLQKLDSVAAQQIPVTNVRRIIRALEVIEVTGELFSQQDSHDVQQSIFNECVIVLNRPRQALYERINQRVAMMVEAGLKEEAYSLYQQDPTQQWQSTKGIGYKEWWAYFENRVTEEEAIAMVQQNSRRYAKRQLTWFRNRMKHTHWIDTSDETQALREALELVHAHLTDGLKEEAYD